MGNKSSTTTAAPSTTSNFIPVTKSAPPTTFSTAITTTTIPTPTPTPTPAPAPAPNPTPTTAPKTTAATTTTSSPVTTTATTTIAKTTTTAATTTTPTPTITSATPTTKNSSTTPTSTAGTTGKPTLYSVTKSITAEADKTKSASSAYAQWYKWSKFDQQKRDKGKVLWYMGSPITTTNPFSLTTTTLTTTTAKIGDDPTKSSDVSNVSAVPSFLLRSTAVYSPPHGDRVPSGRNELINTDTSVFKYYLPENQSKQTAGIHTKATMYRMNTQSKQTPLPTQSPPLTSNASTKVTGDNAPLPTFVSRGLQTDFEAQPMSSSTTQVRYYEKQQPQIVPISAFSNPNSSNTGSSHLASQVPTSQPVLPPIETTPIWSHDQPYSSTSQPSPSILKNSSTVLSREISNPLSEQTHDKVLEELRKRNQNTKDGVYRIKKVHLLEKNIPDNHPPTVTFDLPPSHPPTKANQSISRSERLFSSQFFNRKK